MLNANGVEAILENFPPDDDYNSGWSFWAYEADEVTEVPNLGTVEVIEDFGGGEGSGAERYLVFKVSMVDSSVRLFKKDGYYASYDGTTWDGSFYEVNAVQKTVTVYE